jgi:DNA polymerase-3 subunit delta
MQLDAFLRGAAKGQMAPVYLLAGTELFFRDKFREAVVKFFLEEAGEVVDHDLAETPVRDTLDDAANLGLFALRRVVWLRNAETLLPRREGAASAGKHSLEAVTAYLKRPSPQSLVVFEARTGEKEKISRLEKILEGAALVELAPPAPGDAARYLVEEAKRAGYQMEQSVAMEMVESTGGELARACVELQKLMSYAGERKSLGVEDVRALVPSEPVFIIWELGGAIGRRDPAGALERLQAMMRDGHKALPTLGLVANHMRKLLRAKAGAKQWLPDEVRRQAQKIPLPHLVRALQRLHEADLELRSSPPDERLVLERLILDLARKN